MIKKFVVRIGAYSAIIAITALITITISTYAEKGQGPKIDTKVKSSDSKVKKNNDFKGEKLLQKIIAITDKYYVEDTDKEELFYAAYDGMLSSLDPHSGFLSPESYKEMNVQTKGEFGGVGIEITMEQGVLRVISPIDDTPAFNAGVKPGDYITEIDGKAIRGLNINQAVKKIRGKIGTKVVLTIIRKGEKEPLETSLVRSTIKIVSVKYKDLPNKVGYFRITAFSDNTTVSLVSYVKKMLAKYKGDFSGIVLDLRNNPGGLLTQSISVSDLFLESGIIVSTKGRNEKVQDEFKAKAGDMLKGKPIVVLINQGSASASEIVAGALQDHKRAIIMGKKSFGKGSVQTIIPLEKGKVAMRLTTSKYYTPSGRSIQAEGIVPDVEVEQVEIKKEKQRKYVSEADLDGHLENSDKKVVAPINKEKSLKEIYESDFQLGRAIDLIKVISIVK